MWRHTETDRQTGFAAGQTDRQWQKRQLPITRGEERRDWATVLAAAVSANQ